MNRNISALFLYFLFTPLTAFATIGTGVLVVDEPSGGGIVNGATFGMLPIVPTCVC